METSKFCRLLAITYACFCATGTTTGDEIPVGEGPSSHSTASEPMDSSDHPVNMMTISYLEKVIQTNYLTEMIAFMGSPDDFVNSWDDHWDEWLLYAIGFTVCAAIGVALLVAMYCICCSRCTSCCCCCCKRRKKRKYREKSHFSKGCFICCTVLLFAIVIGLTISLIPMFTQNIQVNEEMTVGIWNALNTSIDTAYSYLTNSVDDINDVLYDGYVDTETLVFDVLYGVPKHIVEVLENATGLGQAVNDAVTFAASLPDLETHLTAADDLTVTLQKQQTVLGNNLTVLVSEIINSSSCSVPTSRPDVCKEVEEITVVVDFSEIDLTNAVTVVNEAVDKGFVEIVSNISAQVSELLRDLNDSIVPAIDGAANQSLVAKQQLEELVTSFNATVSSLQVDEAKETLTSFQNDELYTMIVDIIYWTVLFMLILMAFINALFFAGLVLGIFLPFETKYSMWCCSKTCSKGFLYVGTLLVFCSYWIFMILVVLLFVTGGLLHTEACRHVTRITDEKSFAVLSIFDNWMNQSLYENTGYDIPILPFDSYRLCQNDSSIYVALHLEDEWNMTQIQTDAVKEIRKAFENIRNTTIELPQVDLTNPVLDQTLQELDAVFGEDGLNFTAIYRNIERNIVEPNLTLIISDLHEANLTDYADRMQDIEKLVTTMEAEKDDLIYHLKIVENIVAGVSFLQIAQTFNTSEAVINTNGSAMASSILDQTSDETEEILVVFTEQTAYSIENDVARCNEVYAAIEETTDSVCVYFLYAVNGFWFCLGSGTVFLILGVLVSSRLIRTYRSLALNKRRTSSVEEHPDELRAATKKVELEPQELTGEALVVCAVLSDNKLPLGAGQPPQQIDPGSDEVVQQNATPEAIYQEANTVLDQVATDGSVLPEAVTTAGITVAIVEETKYEQVDSKAPSVVAAAPTITANGAAKSPGGEEPIYSVVNKSPKSYNNKDNAREPPIDYEDYEPPIDYN